jgi:hypothetical protein
MLLFYNMPFPFHLAITILSAVMLIIPLQSSQFHFNIASGNMPSMPPKASDSMPPPNDLVNLGRTCSEWWSPKGLVYECGNGSPNQPFVTLNCNPTMKDSSTNCIPSSGPPRGDQNQQLSTLLAPPVTILAPKPSSTNSLPASSTENNNPSPADNNNNNPSLPLKFVTPQLGPDFYLPRTPVPLFSSATDAGEFGAKMGGALGLLPAAAYIAYTPITTITTTTAAGTFTTITFGAGATWGTAALAITGGVVGGALVGAVIAYGLYKLLS